MNRNTVFAGDIHTPLRLNESSRRLLEDLSGHAKHAQGLSSESYNLTISHAFRFVWFRVAKVGTRTMLEHFRISEVKLDVEHAIGIPYPRQMFADYFKFAFVRDPFARLVSCWQNKILDENYFGLSAALRREFEDFGSFLNWVAEQDLDAGDHHLRKQQRLVDLNHVDFIGRMETFGHDFRRVCETLGIGWQGIVKRNASANPGNHDSLRQTHIDRVYRLYETDFQLFGYQRFSQLDSQ